MHRSYSTFATILIMRPPRQKKNKKKPTHMYTHARRTCAARTVAIRCRQPNKPGELGSYNSVSNNSVAGVAFKGSFKRCIQRRFAGGGRRSPL